jgi:hypothetical protein
MVGSCSPAKCRAEFTKSLSIYLDGRGGGREWEESFVSVKLMPEATLREVRVHVLTRAFDA